MELKEARIKAQEIELTELKKELLMLLVLKKRDEATEKVVKYILKNNHIYSTRNDDKSECWIYDNGIYVPEGKSYIKEVCRFFYEGGFTTHLSSTVLNKIEADTYIKQEDFFIVEDISKVPLLNGVLDIYTKQLLPFSPDYKFFNKLPIKYDPEAKCPNIKKFLESTLHQDDVKVIYEMFGYLLLRDYKIEKAFMFYGDGRNGKGKTVELMKNFLGIDNCANISLQALEKDHFAMSELHNKMANLSADLSKQALDQTGNFKSLTGHDLISAGRKFKTRVNFTNFAKMIFCANELPRTKDTTLAFFNRWVLINFRYTFLSQKEIDNLDENKKENIKLADKEVINKIIIPAELSGLLNIALESLKELLKQGDFSYGKSTAEVRNNWIRNSDSATGFIMDHVTEDYEFKVSKVDFRRAYAEYCHLHKLPLLSDKVIKNSLERSVGVTDQFIMEDGQQLPFWVGIKISEVKE